LVLINSPLSKDVQQHIQRYFKSLQPGVNDLAIDNLYQRTARHIEAKLRDQVEIHIGSPTADGVRIELTAPPAIKKYIEKSLPASPHPNGPSIINLYTHGTVKKQTESNLQAIERLEKKTMQNRVWDLEAGEASDQVMRQAYEASQNKQTPWWKTKIF
jgi:hypothetical protein